LQPPWSTPSGIGPFLVHDHVTFSSFALPDGVEVADPFDHSAAFAAWGPIVLELAQIHAIEPWLADAYGTRQRGAGHVSWVVDDLAAESARLESLGCSLIHTASAGAVQVAWHTGGTLFPHPIEVHRAGAPILGMHARLTTLAEGWDGTDPMRPIGGPTS
jgi:hypothetical protein